MRVGTVEADRAATASGYDSAAVAGVECLRCGKPIGTGDFQEVHAFKRFGSMMFMHDECERAK